MIILQVSRFLKEFSDFETNFTPEFRHPPIKGGQELKEIGLRYEIRKMGVYMNENWEKGDDEADEKEELILELQKEFPNQSSLKELVNEIFDEKKKRKQAEEKRQEQAKLDKKKEEMKDLPPVDPELANMEEMRQLALQRFEEFLAR
mmetsp:Transcript_37966/g.33999  ORF Transcript_37966/g.33999 Transcript_37966/m.33999 type:complete len:147 (+) Transcript_37966:217-657(+)